MSSLTNAALFQPSGIITLTTDFGYTDPFVGVMKGQALARFPAARLVDLTHAITVHRPAEAGFWLARSFDYFPRGTVHVAVVDPGVGGTRRIGVVEGEGHLFLAPDNGLLAEVLLRLASPVLRHLDLDALDVAVGLGRASATFHGRDIFAPLAAELASGRLGSHQLGPVVPALSVQVVAGPSVVSGVVEGRVVTVDHFGNLLTNLEASLLARFTNPVVRAAGRDMPVLRTYADVPPGDYLGLINAFGVLEIARSNMSAAAGLALGRGDPVTVRPGGG